MKTNIFLSIAFLGGMLLTSQVLVAQPASDKTAQRLIHINSKGEISNDQGTKLGYISKEDTIFDHNDQKLGFIKGAKVYDAQGNSQGMVKKGGRYYNNDGVFILSTKSIRDKCEILDPKGHKIGTVHKNYKMHACVTHCFFKENDMKE